MRRQEVGFKCPTCNYITVTVLIDEGHLPSFIRCQGSNGLRNIRCMGQAEALGTHMVLPTPPNYEWYIPDAMEMQELNYGKRKWAEIGGLLLRPRRGKAA